MPRSRSRTRGSWRPSGRAVRPIGLALARGVTPPDAIVQVTATGSLPALPAAAKGAGKLAAHVPVHDALLVVVGERVSRAGLDAIQAVAGQGALALQNAGLLARLRDGYASELRRS